VWFERSDSQKWRREDVGTAASNELRSPGDRPEFRFPNGLYDKLTSTTRFPKMLIFDILQPVTNKRDVKQIKQVSIFQ